MRKIFISPSILAANYDFIDKEILEVEEAGAEYLHIDIMDGQFVENVSFSVDFLKNISSIHKMINDVHIMINDPLKYAHEYLEAGADILTFHYETCKDLEEINNVINLIHSYNKKAGISIKPNTDVEVLVPILDKIDLVLIMSVEPGKGGQKFMPNSLEKIKFLRQYIDRHNLNVLIEVDGGVNDSNYHLLIEAGVDILVSGSYIFKGDKKSNIERLRG